jgi:hypothetical protein
MRGNLNRYRRSPWHVPARPIALHFPKWLSDQQHGFPGLRGRFVLVAVQISEAGRDTGARRERVASTAAPACLPRTGIRLHGDADNMPMNMIVSNVIHVCHWYGAPRLRAPARAAALCRAASEESDAKPIQAEDEAFGPRVRLAP